ncbi:MarR family transcriptional regulator [Nocardioides agariphilus]|jgi:DNA-binding MarR family transcriptional regulator|uniref:MarR family transcriptional regulator n=1 Tax=Nocardioides agariphilus TaxID=433664 RepID=A0A930YM71_9ACTN|nr:MarR family transcriptional regulator [Nocardioides agariphilus]MBF4767804.1 MarR family transcriptional regulator [Nocardioides agariphilus]
MTDETGGREGPGVAAWATVLRVHAAVVPKLAREVAAAGLPISWYDVLLVLNAAPERRLRMSDLGAAAVLSREQISRVVTELEHAGLVERVPNPDDKRSSFATITAGGRSRLRAAAPTYIAAIESHFASHLNREELSVIATALGKVLAAEERSGDAGASRSG